MGVPKFYRWISERYPCLSQVLKEYQIPQFDNMYLDMNGIIHPCSHPNDDDAHFRITEEEIFQNIFKYIEVIFRLIKPQKVFFMAVDGVAPRAKMNQQRARRFRSAMDSERLAKEAVAKGETLPSEARFDSNCITPGTEFMVKLQDQLKYFVNNKISSDPAWQKVTIILSGHNVPGEGEHKIMEYIRWSKQQSDYDPNTRHCLYGLDADLMFLGLATHELHFSLLREEVKFGKSIKRITTAEEQNFHLLHLSLFREYLDKEFECLKESLGEEYDLEHIIDDFILLGFLVGNDFVPHLPDFHIHSNTLPILWKTYKEVRPNLDGYLHENGTIDLARFGTYLNILSRFDIERFEIQYEDMKWIGGKAEKNSKSKQEKREEDSEMRAKFGSMMLGDSEDSDSDGQEDDMIMNEFKTVKKRYYVDKFKLQGEKASQDFMQEITLKYIEGLQWILWYYLRGVPSWSWFFPYHYAPYLSDIKNVAEYKIKLELGTPFFPFQQLMAVFPQGSKTLLPESLQELYSNTSPIIDFYPDTFPTDLNGKKQDWEAVVLIPFIEEDRLIKAMSKPLEWMTDDEKARNTHGNCYVCTFDKANTDVYRSSVPDTFPDIVPCLTNMDVRDAHCFRIAPEDLVYKMPSKSADPFRMGFPTSRHLKHTVSFESAGCKIFQHCSRDANCIMIIDSKADKKIEEYSALIGESVYVDFPHLVEALVTGVHNEDTDYMLDGNCVTKKPADKTKKDCFKHVKSRECMNIKSRFGIEAGDVTVMIRVRKIRGRMPVVGPNAVVQLERQWALEDSWCPGQCIVSGVKPPIPIQRQSLDLSLPRMFPRGAKVFLISNPGYGSLCEVNELVDNKVKVTVVIESTPDLSELRDGIDSDVEEWYFSREICSFVNISPFLLSKITSTFQIDISTKPKTNTKFNVGISVKYAQRNMMVPGYARKAANGNWQYSKSCRTILKEYRDTFPELFEELQNHIQSDMIKVSDLFSKYDEQLCKDYIDKIGKYLKSLPIKNSTLIGVGSEMLLPQQVEQLAAILTQHKGNTKHTKMDLKVKPKVLFNPDFQDGILPPDKNAQFELCDRVINVCASHCVPFALQGTVVGIKKFQDQTSDNTIYDVLYDKKFIGGRGMGSFTSHVYSMMPFMLINFTHGKRISESTTNASKPKSKEIKVKSGKKQEQKDKQGDIITTVTIKIDTKKPAQIAGLETDAIKMRDTNKPEKIGGLGIEILQGSNKKKDQDMKRTNISKQVRHVTDHLEDQEEQWAKGNAYNNNMGYDTRRGRRDENVPRGGISPRGRDYDVPPPRRGNKSNYPRSRGGYEPSQGGYDGSRGGYDGSRGGYEQLRGGYERSRGGYNERSRGGHEPSRSGFNRSRGGYAGWRGGYDPSQGNFDDSRGEYNNKSGLGYQGYDRGADRYDERCEGYDQRGQGYDQRGQGYDQRFQGYDQGCQGYLDVQRPQDDSQGYQSLYSDQIYRGQPHQYGSYRGGYQDSRDGHRYQDSRDGHRYQESRDDQRYQESRDGQRHQNKDQNYPKYQQSQRRRDDRRRDEEYEGSFYHGDFYQGRDSNRCHSNSFEGYDGYQDEKSEKTRPSEQTEALKTLLNVDTKLVTSPELTTAEETKARGSAPTDTLKSILGLGLKDVPVRETPINHCDAAPQPIHSSLPPLSSPPAINLAIPPEVLKQYMELIIKTQKQADPIMLAQAMSSAPFLLDSVSFPVQSKVSSASGQTSGSFPSQLSSPHPVQNRVNRIVPFSPSSVMNTEYSNVADIKVISKAIKVPKADPTPIIMSLESAVSALPDPSAQSTPKHKTKTGSSESVDKPKKAPKKLAANFNIKPPSNTKPVGGDE